jgi:enoyl-CoA hydratase/carnithine racemase
MKTDTDLANPEAPLLRTLEEGSVLVVTLNRPERLNASTPQMMQLYMQALLDAAEDCQVRCILVTGAGGNFCAGADMSVLDGLAHGAARTQKLRRHWFLTRIPKPVIALIQGHCVGLGLVIAMMCDMRIGARSAKLHAPFARMGLPAENGVDWVLVHMIGYARAFELLSTGAPVTGDEPVRLGLVNRLVDDDSALEAALALARDISSHSSPSSVAMMKAQLQRCMHGSMADADRLGDLLIGHSIRGAEFQEAIAARKLKRTPTFEALPAGEALRGPGRRTSGATCRRWHH